MGMTFSKDNKKLKVIMKKYIILGISLVFGSLAGYAYYYFVGCRTGSCPITSNWYMTTLYGALMGLIVGFPSRKKSKLSGVTPDREKDIK